MTRAFDRRLSYLSCLRIKHGDHVAQGVAVVGQKTAQLSFKLDFFLQFPIAFKSFQAFMLLGDLDKYGHEKLPILARKFLTF